MTPRDKKALENYRRLLKLYERCEKIKELLEQNRKLLERCEKIEELLEHFKQNYGFYVNVTVSLPAILLMLTSISIMDSMQGFFFISFRSIQFSRLLRYLSFPEETIAELIALKRRRQKQNLPQWKLNLELTTEVLLLLWAIHIQIRLQNLSLPPSKKRNIE
jgi:hypothetical protein